MELIHEKFGTIRAIERDATFWFCAKDVCDALDYEDHKVALRKLDDDEKGAYILPSPGGPQEMLTVNESGLYALILRSNKPRAREFRKWVTNEVLPSLRRTGRYEMPRIYQVQIDDPPLKWVKGILAVRVRWLIEQGCFSEREYKYLKSQSRLNIVQRACHNRPAMVAFDSLPADIKQRASEAYSRYQPQITKLELKGIDLGDAPVRNINDVKPQIVNKWA